MHQSPKKQLVPRRDKYGDVEATSAEAERRLYRGSQPKARKSRSESPREERGWRQQARWA
jgi:hypothetical protein